MIKCRGNIEYETIDGGFNYNKGVTEFKEDAYLSISIRGRVQFDKINSKVVKIRGNFVGSVIDAVNVDVAGDGDINCISGLEWVNIVYSKKINCCSIKSHGTVVVKPREHIGKDFELDLGPVHVKLKHDKEVDCAGTIIDEIIAPNVEINGCNVKEISCNDIVATNCNIKRLIYKNKKISNCNIDKEIAKEN